MKQMMKLAALGGIVALLSTGSAQAFGQSGARQNLDNPRPADSYRGQWYTTPSGCSYSRAQAPGYAVHWVLIINPHHIGQPNAKKSCPFRL